MTRDFDFEIERDSAIENDIPKNRINVAVIY